MKTNRALVALGLAASCLSPAATAALGGDAASVEADLIQMNGTLQTVPGGGYTVHQIQTAAGNAVKEYVSPTGTVFAVTWMGPSLPDLRQLLGSYFTVYVDAAKAQQAGPGPINIQQPGLVVQSGGRMRAFSGRAYVPSMIPQGVTASEIQ